MVTEGSRIVIMPGEKIRLKNDVSRLKKGDVCIVISIGYDYVVADFNGSTSKIRIEDFDTI